MRRFFGSVSPPSGCAVDEHLARDRARADRRSSRRSWFCPRRSVRAARPASRGSTRERHVVDGDERAERLPQISNLEHVCVILSLERRPEAGLRRTAGIVRRKACLGRSSAARAVRRRQEWPRSTKSPPAKLCVVSCIVTDDVRPDEPADVADRIDQRDAAAAPTPLDDEVASVQNGPNIDARPSIATDSVASDGTSAVRRTRWQRERQPADERRSAMCQRRSPVRSECRPTITMPMARDGVRNRAEQADREIAAARRGLHDLRQPEAHRVERDRNREVHDRQQPHAPARRGVANRRGRPTACRRRLLPRDAPRARAARSAVSQRRVGRLLGQQPKHDDAEDDRRQPFERRTAIASPPGRQRRRATAARRRSARRRCRRRRTAVMNAAIGAGALARAETSASGSR